MDKLISGDVLPSNPGFITQFDIIIMSSPASTTAPTTLQQHANNTMHNMIETSSSSVTFSDGTTSNADLSEFLCRKVKIDSITWSVGGNVASIIFPWDLFLNNAAVKRKLQNYSLLKGDLKITILVNGTPFHIGMLLCSYSYLAKTNEVVTIGGDTQLVTRSQRPHIWCNVSTNKGGCICVPYYNPNNFIQLTTTRQTLNSIGRLNIDSVATLAQLSAGTDTVEISVFAELMNPVISGPTSSLVAFSGTSKQNVLDYFKIETQSSEYTKPNGGVISAPASAVAAIAGRLTDVPVIGPFALATQIGATAIGSIARLFGFSKPHSVEAIKPMRNFPVSNLATSEGEDTSQKLTLTEKQELSIDTRVVGLDGTDELTIDYLSTKETYVTQFDWDVGDSDYIFAIDVDPMVERRSPDAGSSTRIIPTALSFVSRVFSEWSGTIYIRFQVVGSQYHRGRLAAVYEPYGPPSNDPYNVTFNSIIDLGDGRDFTMGMKWQQPQGYQFCDKSTSRSFFTAGVPAGAWISDAESSNGALYLRVVNKLTSPDSVTGVKVLVSIYAGDDFELVNPSQELNLTRFLPVAQSETHSNFNIDRFFIVPQSAVEETPILENSPEAEINVVDVTQGVVIKENQKPLGFYGEKVGSLRCLLKRYSPVRTIYAQNATGTTNKFLHYIRQYPLDPGFDPNGIDLTGSGTPYTYASVTLMSYMRHAYSGWKGGIRWKFTANTDMHSIYAVRLTGENGRPLLANWKAIGLVTPLTNVGAAQGNMSFLFNRNGISGGALTQNRSQDALEVEVPYHIPLRFSKTTPSFTTTSNTLSAQYPGGDTLALFSVSDNTGKAIVMDTYVSAAEDFNLFGFVGAPVMWQSSIPSS